MAAKKSKSSTDKLISVFHHKAFNVGFFLALFALLGGSFYIMQSSAATAVSVKGCTVSGNVGQTYPGYSVGAYIDTRYIGGDTTVSKNGRFSFKLHDLDKQSNLISITYGSATSGGELGTITAGPCL